MVVLVLHQPSYSACAVLTENIQYRRESYSGFGDGGVPGAATTGFVGPSGRGTFSVSSVVAAATGAGASVAAGASAATGASTFAVASGAVSAGAVSAGAVAVSAVAAVVVAVVVATSPPPPLLHNIAGLGASFFARYSPHALHSDPPPVLSFLQNGVCVAPQFTHVLHSFPLPRRFRFDPPPALPEPLSSSLPLLARSRFIPYAPFPPRAECVGAWINGGGCCIAAAAAAIAAGFRWFNIGNPPGIIIFPAPPGAAPAPPVVPGLGGAPLQR